MVFHIRVCPCNHHAIQGLDSSIPEGSFVLPSSQYTPTNVISILHILARFCEPEDQLAQQGSPLVPDSAAAGKVA